jgi:hypothetical protein
MRTYLRFAQPLIFLLLGAMFIRAKRAGRWKRPWTFPLAMTLLGLAVVASLLGTVLELLGM